MNWKISLILFCGLVSIISPVFSQANRGNRPQTRPANRRTRPTRPRGNRGNANRRPSRRGRPVPTASPSSTECEMIYVPMCRGLVGYSHTRLPNQFGHTNQLAVYRALEYMWAFMDIGCSADFRVTACGYYLPKCTPGQTGVQLPCKETCNRARKCKKRMRQLQSRWPTTFRCRALASRRAGNCIPPAARAPSCQQRHVTCEANPIPMCQNLTFSHGSLPNMFLQCHVQEIENEMDQFQDLLTSNCSPHIRFFICGIYMPYCVRAETPFALPCREICEDVRSGCERIYQRNRGGLPWPNKFQCHRYPLSTNTLQVCASPSDVTLRTPDIQTAGNSTAPRNNRNSRNNRNNRNSRTNRINRNRNNRNSGN